MTRLPHLLPRRLALGVAALALLGALSVPVASSTDVCRDLTVGLAAPSAEEGLESQGIDLELRILHVRIEFPWLKSLPITPGHHIVISWMARTEG